MFFLDAQRIGRRIVAAVGCLWLATGAVAAPRPEVALDQSWRFRFGDVPEAARLTEAPADWTAVTLPHTWNAQDGADGGSNYAKGAAWYVRRFDVSRAWRGQRIFLQFDGASRRAEVFVNGQRLGEHVGGYARFRFDVTDAVKFSGGNVLAVRVSNADDGTPPISADFTFFGGLYRRVKLFATDAVHLDALDFASDGAYLAQEKVSAAQAELATKVCVRNDTAKATRATVRVELLDAKGKSLASVQQETEVAPATVAEVKQPLQLAQPHLWNGRKDPYLHTAKISVWVGGKLKDEITQRVGLRSFRVDPDKGFFLNGEHLDLHGASRHQDRAGKGWAISPADERQDFALMMEMGVTAIRVAHYPQSDLWFDLADENGVVTWAEIPLVNEVAATPEYAANAEQQLKELIRQHYNRPSICFWGVGNETREVGESSGKEKPNAPTADRVITALNTLAHAEDATRPTTYASHHRNDDIRNFHTDILAFNKYFGWYGNGKPSDFIGWIDGVHAAHPTLPIGISEYGYGANIAQHDASGKKPEPGGAFHPEEYQATAHETLWLAMKTRDFIWAKFIWNMFDFAADQRSEGEAPGMNDKGLVTYNRKVKKDAFFWYQANWSDTPMVHIASRRYVERPEKKTEIKVYSNASQAELWLNGKSCGTIASADHIFRWQVELADGENRIVAQAGKLRDECKLTFLTKETK